MGVDDNAPRGIFHTRSSLKNRGAVFSLGARGDVIGAQLKAPIIVPHAASKAETKVRYCCHILDIKFKLFHFCSILTNLYSGAYNSHCWKMPAENSYS
jgi:hypothetical protein